MENAGLITWSERVLLAPPDEETIRFQRVAGLHQRARDGAPVVRRPRDAGVVGRRLAQRVLRHVDGGPDDHRVEAGVGRGRRAGRGELERHVRRHARLGAQDPPGDQDQRRHRQRVRRDHVPEGRGGPDDVRGVDRAREVPRRRARVPRGAPLRQRDRGRLPAGDRGRQRSRASRRRSRRSSISRACRSSPSRSTAPAVLPARQPDALAEAPAAARLERRGARDLAGAGVRARGRRAARPAAAAAS